MGEVRLENLIIEKPFLLPDCNRLLGLKLNGSTTFNFVKVPQFLHNNSRVISYKSGAFFACALFLL